LSNNGVVTTKKVSCPRCSKKRNKKKLGGKNVPEGKVGKISIKISSNGDCSWSGIKEVTCPECRQQIRFEYMTDETGKVRMRYL